MGKGTVALDVPASRVSGPTSRTALKFYLACKVSVVFYLTTVLPDIPSRRSKVVRGYFQTTVLTRFAANTISYLLTIAFKVNFCFPMSIVDRAWEKAY
ncbi:hypothetical protein CLCR_02686 [Cladophialophora carrionii]|uniref:Uncharacterized protein n=1 Tax=Cladophialophora carrionii TaxID=86049 RepID=A0A1C1CEQ0_9EURO|nr:hypothetical protein CLCR_02686 [Cladophialophora carrionii]